MIGYVRQLLRATPLVSLLAVVSLVLAACGTEAPDDTGAQPETPADQTETGDVATEAGDEEELRDVSVRIGFVPFSAYGAVVSLYMRDNELVEKRGRELGLNIEAEWNGFPGCPPQIQVLVAQDLDISGCGFIPTQRAILEGQDIRIFSIYEGALDVWLAVRPDSDIQSVEDLKGKTVGTFVGGDIEFFLTQLLDAHLGSPNPEDHDITVVNVPSPAAMADMPRGVDAVTIFGPAFLQGREQGTLVGLVSNQGTTGEAWEEGEGAGPPSQMENSPAFPEAHMLHRAVWIARGEIVDNEPEVIEAFYLAQHDALEQLGAMDPAEVAELASADWEISGDLGASIVEDDLLWKRGWAWWTKGDIEGLVLNGTLGQEAGVFEEIIGQEELFENMRTTASIAERAYGKVGFPDADTFLDTSMDIRGEPFWEFLAE